MSCAKVAAGALCGRVLPAKRMARAALNVLGDGVFWSRSRAEIRKLLEAYGDGSPEGIYEIFERYRGMGWYRRVGATQIPSEFRALIAEVRARRPRTIVEIGTARGGSLLAWCRLAEELVVSIDLPGGIHGGGYVAPRGKLYREFSHGRRSVEVEVLREDSHQHRTAGMVSRMLKGRPVDFLFIDGDHTYEGVKRDFELWKPLVDRTGMVALHDIVNHPQQPSIDVHRFWREIRGSFKTQELVENHQGGYGIGLVHLS